MNGFRSVVSSEAPTAIWKNGDFVSPCRFA